MDELPVLPGFREMALRRMAAERAGLVRALVAQRQTAGLSQTEVAARMGGGDVNGNPTLYDAVQKARKLVERDRVKFVLGNVNSALSLAMAQVMAGLGGNPRVS